MAETETETAGLSAARLAEIERQVAIGREPALGARRWECDTITDLLAEVRRLRAVLGTLLALAPEDDHYVGEAGYESWASDEYEAARREARAALDGAA